MEINQVFPQGEQIKLLDGNTYTFSIPRLKELALLEEKYGMSYADAFNLLDWTSAKNSAYMLFLLLRRNHPDLTPEAVSELVDMTNIMSVNTAITRMIQKARPTPEQEEVMLKNSQGRDSQNNG